jgi:hypothetical protein
MPIRFQADADLDPVREVVDALILIWAATQSEEWINRIAYLPI